MPTDIKKWFTEEMRFLIMISSVVVTLTVFLGNMGESISLIDQRVENIEGNHLIHIQDSVEELEDKVTTITEVVIRIEESLKKE